MTSNPIYLTRAGTLRLHRVSRSDVLVYRSRDNTLYLETPFLEPSEGALISEDGNACFSSDQLMSCGDPSLAALAERALEVFGG
jgi:hypothetical protein